MQAKEILTPKNMLIALGSIVILMSLWGMTALSGLLHGNFQNLMSEE